MGEKTEIDRYSREMMEKYNIHGSKQTTETREEVNEDKERTEQDDGRLSVNDIAPLRFTVSGTRGEAVCGAGMIIKLDERLTVLVKTDAAGDSGIIAFVPADDEENVTVSVRAHGFCPVNEAQVRLLRGKVLEIPVCLEKAPMMFSLFED